MKDAQGRYMCRECASAMRARPAAPVAAAPIVAAHDDDLMASLVDDSVKSQGAPCPGCGFPMKSGAVLCTRCGFNTHTGTAMRTMVTADQAEKEESSGRTIGIQMNGGPIWAMVFGAVGALIGGLIWSVITYQTQMDIGPLALLVAACCGGGVALGARGDTGIHTGLMGAGYAAATLLIARYAVIDQFVHDAVEQVRREVDSAAEDFRVALMTDDEAQVSIADDVVIEAEDRGETLRWPRGQTLETASRPGDYPPGIWDKAQRRWRGMDAAAREKYKADRKAAIEEEMRVASEELRAAISGATDEAFQESLTGGGGGISRRRRGPIYWLIIGVIVGFGIGSGGKLHE
ncbi:MAG: hypothetical protein H6811_10275 [Phycisphaeraceae bacterium]|nr:hypothetical protein [Phycisphaeraceae bacterium]